MRSQTTFTQIRRIMKLHEDGLKPAEISAQVFVTEAAVKHVIAVRFPEKKKPKKKEKEEPVTEE